jgi:hypothetical protein
MTVNLTINIRKTKVMKFRRGGMITEEDSINCDKETRFSFKLQVFGHHFADCRNYLFNTCHCMMYSYYKGSEWH